jgi:hypothetical protein
MVLMSGASGVNATIQLYVGSTAISNVGYFAPIISSNFCSLQYTYTYNNTVANNTISTYGYASGSGATAYNTSNQWGYLQLTRIT